MPVTIRNTDILFNNGTTQSTAATPDSTDFGGVGSYAILMNAANTNIARGGTAAGSALRIDYNTNTSVFSPWGAWGNTTFNSAYNGGGNAVSGTWRRMNSGPTHFTTFGPYGDSSIWYSGLYVRIS